MKYDIHPEAITEYAEAVQYYAEQEGKIVTSFVNAIEGAIYRIYEFPQRYPVLDDEIRRFLVPRFPYAILYEIQTDSIIIWSVMHCRRDPEAWKSRLGKR